MLTERAITSRVMARRKDAKDASAARQKAFGEMIRRARTLAGMKGIELARRADIDPVHLSRIENGHSGVSRETAIALARALDLDETETLNRAGHHEFDGFMVFASTPKTNQLVSRFLALPSERQRDALALIDALWRLHRIDKGQTEEAPPGPQPDQDDLTAGTEPSQPDLPIVESQALTSDPKGENDRARNPGRRAPKAVRDDIADAQAHRAEVIRRRKEQRDGG